MSADIEQANGWFQKHVLESLESLKNEVMRLRDSSAKVHQRIDDIHKPPCKEFLGLNKQVSKNATTLGFFKWLMGGLVLSLIGLVVTLLLVIAQKGGP